MLPIRLCYSPVKISKVRIDQLGHDVISRPPGVALSPRTRPTWAAEGGGESAV